MHVHLAEASSTIQITHQCLGSRCMHIRKYDIHMQHMQHNILAIFIIRLIADSRKRFLSGQFCVTVTRETLSKNHPYTESSFPMGYIALPVVLLAPSLTETYMLHRYFYCSVHRELGI